MTGHFPFVMQSVKCQVSRCERWAEALRPTLRGTIWVCSEHATLYPYRGWDGIPSHHPKARP